MRLEFAQEQTTILDNIDPSCTSTTCGAIAHALRAKESMKPIEADVEKRKLELKKIETEKIERIKKATIEFDKAQQTIESEKASKLAAYELVTKAAADGNKALESRLIEFKQVSDQHTETKWAIEATERAIDEYNKAVADSADIPALRERLDSIQKDIDRLQSEKATIQTRHDQSISRINEEIDKFEQLLSDLLQNGCPEIKAATDRWDKLIAQTNEKKERARKAIFNVEKQIDDQVDTAIASLREKHASITEQLGKLTEQNRLTTQRLTKLKEQMAQKAVLQKQLTSLKADHAKVSEEAREWSYLKYACSKDGFRALEIDSVAPAIAAAANELLHSTFGSGTSIEIITQDPETSKEILDIMVHTADGDCTEITMFSGGEKVWLLKACRLALTMISKERSGRIIQTCFADEEDGALDPDKALQFVNLYRAFIVQGDFHTGFFISHKPACIAMADHLITFSTSGVSIN